jgi:hypothetical protein
MSFPDVAKQNELISDIAVRIRNLKTGQDLAWYYFDEGSAPRISLISTTDVRRSEWSPDPDGGRRPYGSATFIGLREDGHILQTSPSSRSTAPRYIVIPELGQVFKTANFPGLTNNAFVLASCEK